VRGATSTTFVYNGDGHRVKSVLNDVTTSYIGAHFEWTGSTGTPIKYDYAAAPALPRTRAGLKSRTATPATIRMA